MDLEGETEKEGQKRKREVRERDLVSPVIAEDYIISNAMFFGINIYAPLS